MANELQIEPNAEGHRYCVVAARFNETYVRRLVDAALDVLRGRGAQEEHLDVIWVPGSFELPLACRWAAASQRFDAVLAFGVLLRGQTEHFRLVAEAASQGLMRIGIETDVPVLDGIIAADSAELVAARTGGAVGNRGSEVALAAVQMAQLKRTIENW